MCECTAHLFFSRSVGGHTQRAPPDANLLPALLTPPSRSGTALGHSCHAAREIHTSTDCAPTSPHRQVWRLKHTNVCLGICSGAEQMQSAESWRVKPLKKRGTFCRSTYTGCKCCKNCTWICLSPKFPCRQVLCEISGAAMCYHHAS